MNGVTRFHSLRWIRVTSDSTAGCGVEEFIDTTRSYFKTVWADGYTEITDIHATHTGQAIKEIKTSLGLSVYKSPKMCYNINVKTKDKSEVHNMDIKKLEGSLSFADFAEGLVAYGNCASLGEVWEKCVSCNHCEHKVTCQQFADEHYELNIKCHQFIDMLLGQKTFEEVLKEIEENDN